MITHISSSLSGSAQWLVADTSVMFINIYQFVNRTGASITTSKTKGVAVDSRTFKVGDPVSIAVPVGQWKVESSSDGKNWNMVGIFTSMSTISDSVSSNAGLTINIPLDGNISTPVKWTRYTMVKSLTPLPDNSFLQNQVDWLTMTMLSIANTLQLPADKTLKDLPSWAVNVMSKLPSNTIL
jgi:hypothetical protein